jgi:hypothetical protein
LNFSNKETTKLTQDTSIKALDDFRSSNHRLTINPTRIFLPYHVKEWLFEQGYDTEEKIIKLMNDILIETSH